MRSVPALTNPKVHLRTSARDVSERQGDFALSLDSYTVLQSCTEYGQ